jgi:hypothetical protein
MPKASGTSGRIYWYEIVGGEVPKALGMSQLAMLA